MEEVSWRKLAQAKIDRMPQKAKDVRERAMADLFYFAKLVNPGYMYGEVHKEVYRWMQDYALFGQGDGLTANKLIMLPRAHLKSHMVATWCAWVITRHPEVTMLYVSATAELAEVQLFDIKNILGGSTYTRFFPEYINPQEGKRQKWSTKKVIIDHIKRTKEGIRDATIATAGLTTNTTGWHADIVVSDDIVVPENAYTEEGRDSVRKKTSQFTSIRNAGGFTMACGTRYHPADVYDTWKGQFYNLYNKEEEIIDQAPVWEVKEYAVETDGIFIWPRMVRPEDNKAYGFGLPILDRIKAEYEDRVQFHAQYYNDPNDPGSERINREKFQYYDRRHLKSTGGNWFFKDKRLNIYAAVDFAFSLNKKSDFTAIVVIGIDCDGMVYLLDIDRFKSDRTLQYFEHIKNLHEQWRFKRLRAEVTIAQQVIVNDIKDYLKKDGMSLPVDDYRPNRKEGSKEERIAATLEWRYEEQLIWHYMGGNTPVLEEELIQARPKNDDVKDALASAISFAVKPKQRRSKSSVNELIGTSNNKASRFGGMPF
jgi:phage terminase large subunit-like protein